MVTNSANIWFRTASGAELEYDAPRPLTLPEISRLRALGLLDTEECNTRWYQYGCGCPACAARANQAGEFGYDAKTGLLNSKPQPKQPWERAA